MYMFPRQFGLHNVFTSSVDPFQTSHKFQDYTLREVEIARKFGRLESAAHVRQIKVPKRLRGAAEQLVERVQIAHGRCSYVEMLRYYCPVCLAVASTSPLLIILDSWDLCRVYWRMECWRE